MMPLAGILFKSFKDFFAAHSRRTVRLSLKESTSQRLYDKVVSRVGRKERVVAGYDYPRRGKCGGDAAQHVRNGLTAFGVSHVIYLAGI
jgi:hypothetical protein